VPSAADGISPVELDGFSQRDAQGLKKLVAGGLLAVHARHLFDPANPDTCFALGEL